MLPQEGALTAQEQEQMAKLVRREMFSNPHVQLK